MIRIKVAVIGAGLAGCEASYQLAKRGIDVVLYDMKPSFFTPAHSNPNFCELVCSNSLKSDDSLVASGLLKRELEAFDSIVLKCARQTRVSAGGALAVDREKFSSLVTEEIKKFPNIEIISTVVEDIPQADFVIVATGPLTDGKLLQSLSKILKTENLAFYDASSPIVTYDSIDFDFAFVGDRYGKGDGDYINCPMNKEEYEKFYDALISAQTVELHSFEKKEIFEGCMPIEIMAKRGKDSIRFGPLKPVGLTNPNTNEKPYAVVQLRKEDENSVAYNLVGFQTNLTFGEQKRVFSMIPGLQNANFTRYGVMHRNTFVNAPEVLEKTFQLKNDKHIFIAGQLSGVEGYIESVMSGLLCGINCYLEINGKDKIALSSNTMMGAIINYITTENRKKFQPMNANFGVVAPLDTIIRDEKLKKQKIYERSMEEIQKEVLRIEK